MKRKDHKSIQEAYFVVHRATQAMERRNTEATERFRAGALDAETFCALRSEYKVCEALYDFAFAALRYGQQHALEHYGPRVARFGAVCTF